MLQLSIDRYHIGWICALSSEYAAAKAMLDERHEMVSEQDPADSNSYTLGRIHNHNVVIACLPAGVDGTNAAAVVAANLSRTFRSLRFGLMVGIGGGIPDLPRGVDIRLGDVVVSQPSGVDGGVVQYDKRKTFNDNQFERKGQLNKPPTALLTALSNLKAEHQMTESRASIYLEQMLQNRPKMQTLGYAFPAQEVDILQCAHSPQTHTRCDDCENGKIKREPRPSTQPVVHYGTIASGNQVIKSAEHRNRLRNECGGAICVEMEAAGLMDNFPCLVIRGICDYADSSKNDKWHNYAAATAAAFAKELLLYVSVEQTGHERPIQEILDQLHQHFQRQQDHNVATQEHNRQQEIHYLDDRHRNCHRVFDSSDYERYKNININAVPGTCRWVLDDPQYHQWVESTSNDLLWISADPGCGKSVLSKSLVDAWLASPRPSETTEMPERLYTICHFFFKDNEEQSSLATALCAILHQLLTYQPKLIDHALPAFDKSKEKELTKKIDELWRILQSAASDTSAQPVICVIDALDECYDADRLRFIDLLHQFYKDSRSRSNTQGCLKWLVTSRPHDDIQDRFGQLLSDIPLIRLRGEDKNDQIREEIEIVINQRMMELGRQCRLSDEKREEVTQQLLTMNNRTYLWLHLVFTNIAATFKRSARPNQVKIPSLPATVDQAYEDILKRIVDAEEKCHAKTVLTIIVGARRPLSIAEMALAFDVATLPEKPRSLADLSVDASGLGDKIRGWCNLFVFINHNRLYLIHQTAKEFLLNYQDEPIREPDSWKHCLRPLEVDMAMAKVCVFFLCLSDFNAASQDDGPFQENDSICAFFAFASEHWAEYVRVVEADLDDQILKCVYLLYEAESERFRRWTTIMWRTSPFKSGMGFGMNDIHLATFNRHYRVLQCILRKTPRVVNQLDAQKRTSLCWAARRNYKEIVKLLLTRRMIDVNLGKPLYYAAYFGYTDIVKMLLAQPKIDVNQGGALSWAASRGHKDIVCLLLNQPDIDTELGNPLCQAAQHGHKAIVELFLARPDTDLNRGAPLTSVVQKGYIEVLQLLLAQPDIDVNLGDLLYEAAYFGHVEIVELLLAQPNIGVNLEKPLHWALRRGHKKIVEILLTHPHVNVHLEELVRQAVQDGYVGILELLLAQPNINIDLQSLPCDAVRFRRQEILRLLLARPDIDVDKDDLLDQAVYDNSADIVKLFLTYPDVNVNHNVNVKFRQRLGWAAHKGFDQIVKLFLTHPNINVNEDSPLARAAMEGHITTVELLLAHPDIDVNLGEPLAAAARNGREKTVELLLSCRDVDANLGEPLAAAAGNGREKTVELLLSCRDVDVNRGEPLAAAARNGYDKIVKLLLTHPDIDVNIGEPLALAARNWRKTTEAILLNDLGTSVNLEKLLARAVWNQEEKTAAELGDYPDFIVNVVKLVAAAIRQGHGKIIKLLLNHPDININLGEPLAEAAQRGHAKIVELLLTHQDINVNQGKPLAVAAGEWYQRVTDLLGPHYYPVKQGAILTKIARNLLENVKEPPPTGSGHLGQVEPSENQLKHRIVDIADYQTIVKLLLTHPNIDVDRGGPYVQAARRGCETIAGQLLDHLDDEISLQALILGA